MLQRGFIMRRRPMVFWAVHDSRPKGPPTMASRSALAKLAKNIPAPIREMLGTPPLVFGESPAVYYGMLASVAESIKPDNFITWTLLKDWVDNQIEIVRYRKFKSQMITEPRRKEIQDKIDHWVLHTPDPNKTNELIRTAIARRLETEKEKGTSEEDIEKIKREITKNLRDAAATDEKQAERNLLYWKGLAITERDLAASWHSWIGGVNKINALQDAAEKKALDARNELQRDLRSRAFGGWDGVISPDIVETILAELGATRALTKPRPVDQPIEAGPSKTSGDLGRQPDRRVGGVLRKLFQAA
jgi:hypothetical protein